MILQGKEVPPMEPRLFTIEEASRILGGCSTWTLRKHIQRRNVRSVRLGQRVYVPVDEIERIQRDGLPPLSQGPRRDEAEKQEQGAAAATAAVAT